MRLCVWGKCVFLTDKKHQIFVLSYFNTNIVISLMTVQELVCNFKVSNNKRKLASIYKCVLFNTFNISRPFTIYVQSLGLVYINQQSNYIKMDKSILKRKIVIYPETF